MNPNYAALSASDGVGEPVRATVQSPGRSIGSSTIPVNATTNWPTGTFIATTGTLLSSGKLDPATVQVFYGTASGTDITITAYAAGYTDKGNLAGDVVVIKPSTEWANIVAEGILGTTQFPQNFRNFVESTGGVWSAGAGLVGSGTSGYVWYNGARSAMAAVTNHTFTASKDTYIDYNPATAAWTYVPVTNGAAEPAVTASSVRVAKVVTGASAITSVSQTNYQAQIGAANIDWASVGYVTSSLNNNPSLSPSGSSSPVYSTNNNSITLNPGTYLITVTGGMRITLSSQDATFGVDVYDGTSELFASSAITTMGGTSGTFWPSARAQGVVTLSAQKTLTVRVFETYGTGATISGLNTSIEFERVG